MSDLYFMATDREGKKLLEKFKALHPEGSNVVLKLLLRFYIKFSGWHTKKGRNPIIAFQDFIEREVAGKPYSTDEERIRYLTELVERGEEKIDVSKGGVTQELQELKRMISTIKTGSPPSSGVLSQPQTSASHRSLDDFKPTEASTLTKVGEAKPKKRKSYRDVRKKSGVKKVDF